MEQEKSAPKRKYRFALHIQVYVFFSILFLLAGSIFLAGSIGYREGNPDATLLGAASGAVIFGALLPLIARYCSSEVLSYWDGLRLVAHYVSIGVGWISLLFAVVCVSACIFLSALFMLYGVATNNRGFAQRQFIRLLQVISKHRMYQ